MFNDKYGLTAAVLAGTKTQTRRLVPDKLLSRYGHRHDKYNRYFLNDLIRNARYKVGEVVAVAQPYKVFYGDFKEPLRTELINSAGFMNKMFVKPHSRNIDGGKVDKMARKRCCCQL